MQMIVRTAQILLVVLTLTFGVGSVLAAVFHKVVNPVMALTVLGFFTGCVAAIASWHIKEKQL